MPRPLRFVAVLLLVPTVAWAQAASRSLSADRLRLGTDTFDLVVESPGTRTGPQREMSVNSLLTGTGADAGSLIAVSTFEMKDAAGETRSRYIDSTIVSAKDLRLQRSHQTIVGGSSSIVRDVRGIVRGSTFVITDSTEGSPLKTTRLSLQSDAGEVLTVPFLFQRAAPLSATWTARIAAVDQLSARLTHIDIDSVRAGMYSGRSAWRVYSRVDASRRLVGVIDSSTRDLLATEVWSPQGNLLVTNVNRRYAAPSAEPGVVATRTVASRTDTASLGKIAGHYYLEGVREVGSELLLRPDGTFAFMLAYGALDEEGEGRWSVTDSAVVLQSTASPRPASIVLQSSSGKSRDSLRIFVVDTAGRPMGGLGLDASRNKAGGLTAQIPRDGYTINYRPGQPPTEIGIGVDIFNFRVPFSLAAPLKAQYRFVFDRGDLGRRRFEQQRLNVEEGRVIMTMNGRRMTYVKH